MPAQSSEAMAAIVALDECVKPSLYELGDTHRGIGYVGSGK